MKGWLRGGICLLLACFLQGLLAAVTPWRVPLLPGVVCLLGLRLGATAGAALGGFAGLLWLCAGQGYTPLALFPALGGWTGGFSPTGREALPRRWLLCLPGLALYAVLECLLHLWGGMSFRLLGTSFLLSLACLPLAELVCALCFWKKGPRKRRVRSL